MIDRILGGSFSPYDKEPLVYDVFFSLWRYRIQIAEGRVKSFLSVAAQNRAKTFLLHRRGEIPIDPDTIAGRSLREREIPEIVERKIYIEERFAILDRKTRELFFRRYILDETVEKAAMDLGMKYSTAKSRLMRVRERLRKNAEVYRV